MLPLIVYSNSKNKTAQFFRWQEHINFAKMYKKGGLCHQSMFSKKSLFAKIGKFDLAYKIFSDYEWTLRALKQGASVGYLNQTISIFELGGLSTADTRKKTNDIYHEKHLIENKYFGRSLHYRMYKILSSIYSRVPISVRNAIMYKDLNKNKINKS